MDLELMADSIVPLLGGAWLTAQLVALSLLFGLGLAVAIGLMRLSPNRYVAGSAYAYVFVFRGTPLLVQIALIYYGIGQFEFVRDSFLWAVFREAYWCAILALTLNTAAYTAEIVRGGILSVPHGQIEAARAYGMSVAQVYRRVIAPQAIRQALPAYGNEVILMVKASSLASTITLMEITGVAKRLISRTYAPIEIFIVAGAIYLAINFLATRAIRHAEWRVTPELRPPREPALRRPAPRLGPGFKGWGLKGWGLKGWGLKGWGLKGWGLKGRRG
jgi:octopine/nopaline transport system permease protein